METVKIKYSGRFDQAKYWKHLSVYLSDMFLCKMFHA